MLSHIRNFAKSKWAVGLLVLMAMALLITGNEQFDVLSQVGPRHVISAGDRSVNAPEFKSELDGILAQQSQQAGRPLTMEELTAGGGLTQFLSQKAQSLGFLAWTWDVGVRPGAELVLRHIRQESAFFDSVTGRFSQQQYVTVLQENNLTPARFEQEQRDMYAQRHIGLAIGAGARLPRVYGAVLASQALASRDARWFTVDQAMAGTAGTPTDAQLTTFMNEMADRLRMPEFRSATVVLFDNAADASGAIDDARVQERFRLRQDSLGQPERRTFTTLTAPTREAAQKLTEALRAGQAPAAVGQANNLQPADYADTPRTAVGDPAVAAAVFGMTTGQVSDPIQARVGFVVAKLGAVTPGRPVTLADVREQIVQELREEDVRAGVYRRVQAYEAARTAGKSFDEAVTEVGARKLQIGLVSREGQLRNGQTFNGPPKILETMWAVSKGAASEVVDAGGSQYFVIRVDDVVPAALPALADIREPLAQQWTVRENVRLLTNKANALAARLRAGEDIAAVAASAGAQLQTRTGMGRQSQAEVGPGVFQGVFTSEKGAVFSNPQSENAFVVGRVDAITPPSAVLAAPMAEQIRTQLGQENMNGLLGATLNAGAARTRTSFDEARARTALNLPAADAAPAAGAAGGAPRPAPAPGQ
jgi:peptidyl-prolyl cis-trans isomerase D